MKTWMEQAVNQAPVRGHEKKPFGVVVESAYGHEVIGFIGDQLSYRRAILRIVEGREHRVRFVEHDGGGGLGTANRLSVQLDQVDFGVDLDALGIDHLPVHRHAPFGDGRLGPSTGEDARPGQVHLKSDRRHSRPHQLGSVVEAPGLVDSVGSCLRSLAIPTFSAVWRA